MEEVGILTSRLPNEIFPEFSIASLGNLISFPLKFKHDVPEGRRRDWEYDTEVKDGDSS